MFLVLLWNVRMIDYLKHSGIWISLIVNPWHWHFLVGLYKDLGYNFILTLGLISVRIVVNNKSY